ncbi:MFS transporter [Leucobacter musarum]|uniref:MFS transporter n=1 Tax=Leucobacter musarum TaxID=1930747 RepID=UPI0006A76376|nr:MFS transporter [Leucobacter musarum]
MSLTASAPQPAASDAAARSTRVPAKSWMMLALALLAQAAATMLITAPVYLIPMLHLEQGIPLAAAGTLAAAPTAGMVLTAVLWGAAADRFGERWVIAGGLGLTALAAFLAASSSGLVPLALALVLGGAAGASTNAASGRVVVGWFPRHRRGLAMGIRQMSQPLGTAAAAFVVPPFATAAGISGVFILIGALLAVITVACAIGVRNPPRPVVVPRAPGDPAPESTNPYRTSSFLVRIHAVSVLLVLPQFALSTFGMVWLISGLGWSATAAGVLMGAAQFIGAVGRIVVGAISDRVGDRVRVLRWVALSGIAVMGALAVIGAWHDFTGGVIIGGCVLIIATVVSVADNGLAYTSVAEAAGSGWAGRALGIQNTGQFIASSAVGPGLGAAIALLGYPWVFALVAIAPLVAYPLIPKQDRHA